MRRLLLFLLLAVRPVAADPPLTGVKACNRAAELIREGKPGEALALLESAKDTVAAGDRWVWWGNLALAKEELRDHRGALAAYDESAKLKPGGWFRVQHAVQLFQFRRVEEAAALLPKPDPDDAEIASRLQAALDGPFHDRWPKSAPSLEATGDGWVRVVSDLGADAEEFDDFEKTGDEDRQLGPSPKLLKLALLLETLRSDLIARLNLPADRWPKGKVASVFFVLEPGRFKRLSQSIGGDAPRENQFGFYEPNIKVVLATGSSADDPDALDTLFHEFTHQVLDVYLRERPIWLNEGLAEVAGKAVPAADGTLRWGGIGAAGGKRATRKERITQMLEERRFVPFGEFVRLDVAQWNAADVLDHYAQAWSILDCALNGKDEKLRAVFLRIIADLAAGKPAKDVIDAALPADMCDWWEMRWRTEASR